MLKLQKIGTDDELLRMALLMPTSEKLKNQRKAAKQRLVAYLQLKRIADPIYNVLNEAFIFNLSLEVAHVYNLCAFVDHQITNDLTS